MKTIVLPEFFFPLRGFAASWFVLPPTCENNVFLLMPSFINPQDSFFFSRDSTGFFSCFQVWAALSLRDLSAPCSESAIPVVVLLYPGLLQTVLTRDPSKLRKFLHKIWFSITLPWENSEGGNWFMKSVFMVQPFVTELTIWYKFFKKHLEWSDLLWWWCDFLTLSTTSVPKYN